MAITGGSIGKVHKTLKKHLTKEQYARFLGTLPHDVIVQAVADGNLDYVVAFTLLGSERMMAYMEAETTYDRQKIMSEAIRGYFLKHDLPLPAALQSPFVSTRGPKGESKMAQYQSLLEETENLLTSPPSEELEKYLAEVKEFLQKEIERTQKMYEAAKRHQSKKRNQP